MDQTLPTLIKHIEIIFNNLIVVTIVNNQQLELYLETFFKVDKGFPKFLFHNAPFKKIKKLWPLLKNFPNKYPELA